MTLTLTVLRCPDKVPPQTRHADGGEFSIGRGSENDWVLPDPDRHLSKRHCVLAFRSGYWQLLDTSANGTYHNHDDEPVGPGGGRDLRDGDRLRLGPYEIEVRIADVLPAGRQGVGFGGSSDGGFSGGGFGGARPVPPSGRSSSNDRFMDDPFGDHPVQPTRNPFLEDTGMGGGAPFGSHAPGSSVNLPPDFDPLAADDSNHIFRGPTQSDHAPGIDDAFRPPPPLPVVLPDDWDLDLDLAPRPPQTAVPLAPLPISPPSIHPVTPPPPFPAATPAFAREPDIPPVAPASSPTASLPTASGPTAPPPRDVVPPRVSGVPDGKLLVAFLDGAGIGDAVPADPEATMRALGRTFRAVVSGLRQAIMARAEIKGEFRIERTMIRARGNNPLKFSADDDDALAALLGVGRVTDVDPARAVAEAMRDMRLHELASVSAMQSAVRAMLAQFAPTSLRAKADEAGGLALVPAQRKARAWDMFEKMHTETSRALADDFDSVFGRAFARAYEQALREINDRERPD